MDDSGIEAVLAIAINFALPVTLLVMAYFTGRMVEHKHLKSLTERERATAPTVAMTLKTPMPGQDPESGELVTGSVVISLDYFKRFAAALRSLIGGNVKSYEPLLVRARREAVLRMKEEAIALGYRAVINVRLETSRLASGRSDGKGTAGIEMLAFGTAIR